MVIDKERPAILTAEVIARLKAAHPSSELHMLSSEDGETTVVCKKPPRAEFNRFMQLREDKGSRAMEALFRGCVVYPEAAEIERLMEDRPGLFVKLADKLLQLTGLEQEVVSKKL